MSDWTHVGAAAAIDDPHRHKYNTTGGHLKFKGNYTGWIYARCNVTNPLDNGNPDWNSIEVVFRDQDGAGSKYQVVATLYRVSPTSGAVRWIAKFDSNAAGASAATDSTQRSHAYFRTTSSGFESLNFSYFAYYVALAIYRADTDKNPRIYSVRLGKVPT